MNEIAIKTTGLTKKFKNIVAVDRISFDVKKGGDIRFFRTKRGW